MTNFLPIILSLYEHFRLTGNPIGAAISPYLYGLSLTKRFFLFRLLSLLLAQTLFFWSYGLIALIWSLLLGLSALWLLFYFVIPRILEALINKSPEYILLGFSGQERCKARGSFSVNCL